MNLPTNIPLTMSSREIAELCDKQHKHVMRDAKSMLDQLGEDEKGYAQIWTNPQNGQSYPEYLLPKDLTLTLVAGYNVKLRKRIIDRWIELETGTAQFQIPQTYADALRLAAEQTEKVERQALVIAELQEDAEALDQIANAHGSLTRTDAAKHLGVAPQLLCKWLNTHGWTYRRAGAKDDTAYQSKINAGYLEHKVKTGIKPDGTEWIGTQVRVTPKGLTVLAKAFPRAARAA